MSCWCCCAPTPRSTAAGSSSPRPPREPRALHRRGLYRRLRRVGRAGRRVAGRPPPRAPRHRRARARAAPPAADNKRPPVTPKRKRLWLLVGALGTLAVLAALVVTALNDDVEFVYS